MRAQRLDDSFIEIGQRIGYTQRGSTRRGAVKGRYANGPLCARCAQGATCGDGGRAPSVPAARPVE